MKVQRRERGRKGVKCQPATSMTTWFLSMSAATKSFVWSSSVRTRPETRTGNNTTRPLFLHTHFFTRRYVRVVRWLTMTMRMKVLYRNHCYRKIAARNLLDTIVSLIWPKLDRTLHFDGTTRLQHF